MSHDRYEVAKVHKRVIVRDTETGEMAYTPPNFIRLISRADLQPMVDAANAAGALDITHVMAFERTARRVNLL